jgi:hypothetical protein
MPVINREGIDFTVYATVDDATNYSYGSMDAATWIASSDEVQERTLITATRIFDRQVWLDDFNTYDLRVADNNVVNAAIELAFAIAAGSDVETNDDQGTKDISRLRAGSVEIEYVVGGGSIASFDVPSRWPLPVQEKLRGRIGADTSGFGGAISSGTDGCSVTNNNFGLNRGY